MILNLNTFCSWRLTSVEFRMFKNLCHAASMGLTDVAAQHRWLLKTVWEVFQLSAYCRWLLIQIQLYFQSKWLVSYLMAVLHILPYCCSTILIIKVCWRKNPTFSVTCYKTIGFEPGSACKNKKTLSEVCLIQYIFSAGIEWENPLIPVQSIYHATPIR